MLAGGLRGRPSRGSEQDLALAGPVPDHHEIRTLLEPAEGIGHGGDAHRSKRKILLWQVRVFEGGLAGDAVVPPCRLVHAVRLIPANGDVADDAPLAAVRTPHRSPHYNIGHSGRSRGAVP